MALSSTVTKIRAFDHLSPNVDIKLNGRDQAIIETRIKAPRLSSLRISISGDWLGNPIDLLEYLKLRSSGVYLNPGIQAPLPLVYGNWYGEKGIPCVSIDTDNNLWMVADHPVLSIGSIFVDGVSYTSGANLYTDYLDSTGKNISVVELPTKATSVSAQCGGKINKAGSLIEEPTDILFDILVNVMGFNPSFINTAVLNKSKSYYASKGVYLRYYFNKQNYTAKKAVEQVATDCRSLYLSISGRHSIKPRSVSW